jgi:hypothetical protein
MKHDHDTKAERGSTRAHAQVLILLAMTLFAGPGTGEHDALPKLVRGAIDDERRAEAAVAVAEEIQGEVLSTREDVLAFRREVLAVLAPFESDLSGLPAASESFETRMWKHQERMLEKRDRLRGLMTPAEWEDVFRELRETRREARER